MSEKTLPVTRDGCGHLLCRVRLKQPDETLIDYAADPGEEPVLYPVDDAHPGYSAGVEIYHVWVGGIDIYEWLVPEQIEKITETVMELHDWSSYED